ncbi:MAG: hypothetical protein OXN94_11475 [Chloroflexota bacterium]|nr:hypothetical protein [Chloroflexota bacterium]
MFFQWRAVKGAKHYRYRLVADGQRRVNDRTKKTSVDLGAGEPGQTYTAKVRVKRKDGLSKWANVTAKCPAPAPSPSATFNFVSITSSSATVDIGWENVPAYPDASIMLWAYATENHLDCGRTERSTVHYTLNYIERRFEFDGLCPDNGYMLEFIIKHRIRSSGRIEIEYEGIKRERFRTLP